MAITRDAKRAKWENPSVHLGSDFVQTRVVLSSRKVGE
jgi:hypothetical protein